MAKKELLTVVVLASALALISCDDSSSSPNAAETPTSSDSAIGVLDPNSSANTVDSAIGDDGNLHIDPSTTMSSADNGQVPTSAGDPATPASSADNGQVAPATSSADNGQANPTSAGDPATPASSADNGQVAPATSSADNGQTNPVASSADNGQKPASSADVKPASSADVKSSSSSATPVSSSSEAPKGIFLAEGTDEEKRQLDIEYKEGQGPDGQSVLSYPKQLSSTQKHGVVVWGPGGGEKPGNYPDMIKDLASHGFVVIGIRESPGNGSLAIQAIDWLEKENNNQGSPFYGKLDLTKVGCSGHSMGGLESEQAAIKDERVITAFLNNSGDQGSGAFANIPSHKTAGVVFGERGSERDNAIRDYQSSRQTPACMIEMTGGPMNSEGGWGHGSGPWDGRAITIAWMRWQLGGEDFRKADFVGSSGKYINGPIINHQGKWKGECKNFK